MQRNIKIVGVGGQGVVTAGMAISEAYRIEGINVVMSEIHGLSQRGGSVSVDIRSGNVHSPIIPSSRIDLLLAFEPLEAARFFPTLPAGSTVVMSDERLPPVWLGIRRMEYPDLTGKIESIGKKVRVVSIRAVDMAREAGNYKAVNTVLIGAAFGLDQFGVRKQSLINALKEIIRDRGIEINLKAFEYGIGSVSGMKEISLPS